MKFLISSSFILLGLVCFMMSGYLYFQKINPNRLAFKDIKLQQVNSKNLKPIRLLVPKLDIDVPVLAVKLHGATWPTTEEGAAYLENTPVPGEKGNSVIYGHNFHNILGKLPLVKPGDRIIVLMADGTKKKFKVDSTQEVAPNQTHILDQSLDSRLTLYTCSGIFDSKRFVAVASLL